MFNVSFPDSFLAFSRSLCWWFFVIWYFISHSLFIYICIDVLIACQTLCLLINWKFTIVLFCFCFSARVFISIFLKTLLFAVRWIFLIFIQQIRLDTIALKRSIAKGKSIENPLNFSFVFVLLPNIYVCITRLRITNSTEGPCKRGEWVSVRKKLKPIN